MTDHPGVDVVVDPCERIDLAMVDFGHLHWLPDEQTLAKVRSRHCKEAFDLHIYAVSVRLPAARGAT